MKIVYEVVASCTLDRGDERISLQRGARLKLDVHDHDFDDRQLRQAIDDGKLRPLPLGSDDEARHRR